MIGSGSCWSAKVVVTLTRHGLPLLASTGALCLFWQDQQRHGHHHQTPTQRAIVTARARTSLILKSLPWRKLPHRLSILLIRGTILRPHPGPTLLHGRPPKLPLFYPHPYQSPNHIKDGIEFQRHQLRRIVGSNRFGGENLD